MTSPTYDVVFGSRAATLVLLFLQNYEQAYAREISRTYEDLSLSQVQKQLAKFEEGGALVSRRIGSVRLYEWNQRNPVVESLRAFLQAAICRRKRWTGITCRGGVRDAPARPWSSVLDRKGNHT